MRSSPIRLTKYESGLLLSYVASVIDEKNNLISETNYSDDSFNTQAMELTNLYDLYKKLDNAFKKCEYKKAYSRKEE